MLKPLHLLLISTQTFTTLHFVISISLSQSDLASISSMTDLIANDFRLANSSKSKWKQVSTKFIYFIAKPLPTLPKLQTSESKFLPLISDKLRAREDYYHPPVNHHYQTNSYKTNNYDYKEYKPPPPIYKPPPIYIQAPVYAKEKEKDKSSLLLFGALLFPILALFLQFLLFLFFLQNVSFSCFNLLFLTVLFFLEQHKHHRQCSSFPRKATTPRPERTGSFTLDV